jgi:hypothetical protein
MYLLLAAVAWPAFAAPLAQAAAVPSPPQAQQTQSSCTGRTLAGTVQDSTAAVIPGATVQIDGNPAQSQTSGSDGRFSFKCVPAGPHHLTTSASGFATAEQDLSARSRPTSTSP